MMASQTKKPHYVEPLSSTTVVVHRRPHKTRHSFISDSICAAAAAGTDSISKPARKQLQNKANSTPSKVVLPPINISSFKQQKKKVIFTEGISSISRKTDPTFTVSRKKVITSNLPESVQYSREKSKLVFGNHVYKSMKGKSQKSANIPPILNAIINQHRQVDDVQKLREMTFYQNNKTQYKDITEEEEDDLSDESEEFQTLDYQRKPLLTPTPINSPDLDHEIDIKTKLLRRSSSLPQSHGSPLNSAMMPEIRTNTKSRSKPQTPRYPALPHNIYLGDDDMFAVSGTSRRSPNHSKYSVMEWNRQKAEHLKRDKIKRIPKIPKRDRNEMNYSRNPKIQRHSVNNLNKAYPVAGDQVSQLDLLHQDKLLAHKLLPIYSELSFLQNPPPSEASNVCLGSWRSNEMLISSASSRHSNKSSPRIARGRNSAADGYLVSMDGSVLQDRAIHTNKQTIHILVPREDSPVPSESMTSRSESGFSSVTSSSEHSALSKLPESHLDQQNPHPSADSSESKSDGELLDVPTYPLEMIERFPGSKSPPESEAWNRQEGKSLHRADYDLCNQTHEAVSTHQVEPEEQGSPSFGPRLVLKTDEGIKNHGDVAQKNSSSSSCSNPDVDQQQSAT